MEKEEWKPVKGFENAYMISSLGRLKSIERKDRRGNSVHEKIMKTRIDRGGYERVNLFRFGQKDKRMTIHRLVALAFIPNPLNLPQINHKNEIKTDNRVSNLEWCTAKQNANYGTRIERGASKRRLGVIQLDLNGNEIARYDTISDAAQAVGAKSLGGIWAVISGYKGQTNHFTAYGYKWKRIRLKDNQ